MLAAPVEGEIEIGWPLLRGQDDCVSGGGSDQFMERAEALGAGELGFATG
jgi:hypothetical protein